jgi:hypothetical protein
MQDALAGLVGVYNSTKTENLKATAVSTMSRLLRSNPSLIRVLLQSWGLQLLVLGVLLCLRCALLLACRRL